MREHDYMSILNTVPDIVYKIDAHGRIEYISESVANLGYSPQELVGQHMEALIHPEDINHVSRRRVLPRLSGKRTGSERAPKLFDERRTGSRATRNLIVRLVPKTVGQRGGTEEGVAAAVSAGGQYEQGHDGTKGRFSGTVGSIRALDQDSELYAEISASGQWDKPDPITFEDLLGSVGTIRDVTDRIELERQKVRFQDQLFYTQKMQAIGELAGGIAHDYNNLLGAVAGFADLLDMRLGTENPTVRKYAGRILGAAQKAAELTSQLLAFAGKGNYQSVILDSHTLINEVVSLLSHTIDRRIAIRSALQASLSTVCGDPEQLRNAVLNIALNARDAMAQGGELVFETAYLPPGTKGKGAPEGTVVIAVSDTGCGMDETVRARIFEPFFSTKPKARGSGLGLAAAKGIIEAHGGTIQVESTVDVGTTVRLSIPARRGSEEEASVNRPEPALIGEGKARILIVDDEEAMREVCAEMLESMGYATVACANGAEAAEYYAGHADDIDLVILDMIMPDLNGVACFERIMTVDPEARIILASGYSLDEDAQMLLDKGALEFVQKPFVRRQLARVVGRVVAQ